MEPGSRNLTAASSVTATREVHADRRNGTRDAACQTEDPFLGPEPEEPAPAMKRKPFFLESEEEQTTTDSDEPSRKKAKRSQWSGSRQAGTMPLSGPEVKALAARLLDRSRCRMEEAEKSRREAETAAASSAGGECECRSAASPAGVATRPLPLRCPPCPENATREQWSQYEKECRRISKLVAQDPLTKLLEDLPTLRNPKDTGTRDAVASSRDKEMVLRVARSIVSVYSIASDGNVIWQCTGIVVSWDESKKCARILTSSHIARNRDTAAMLDSKPKIHVQLPNKSVSEGLLLFFDKHYSVALIEITVDFPFQLPSFGSSPNYGQEVFVLARGKESCLLARHGTIVWQDEPGLLSRNYHRFLNYKPRMSCNGGAVIDHDGNVVGMAFLCITKYPAMLVSISTVLTCIEMWIKFSRIARPIMHVLCLRSVELLDVSSREEISYRCIDSGYIVDKVECDSTSENVGIRRGDVIVSFDELGVHPLPKLEDILLSLGWEFLERGFDASTVVDFKLQVYDPIGNCTRSIILPVGFCDAEVDE